MKTVLFNLRATTEDTVERERYDCIVVMTTTWLYDGGHSLVVAYVKKCEMDEPVGKDTILRIWGLLPKYAANQGVLLTNGVVTQEAIQEARGPGYASVPPVNLIDRDILLDILFGSRSGVVVRNVEVYLVDRGFFDSLATDLVCFTRSAVFA